MEGGRTGRWVGKTGEETYGHKCRKRMVGERGRKRDEGRSE